MRVDDETGFGLAEIHIEPNAVGRILVPRIRDIGQRNRHRSAMKRPTKAYLKSWNSSVGMEIL